jgi:haloacid dehalogenase-like hydrolase
MTLRDGLDIQVPQPALLSLPDDVHVVTRDLVERAKPDPHLFLAAARRLGVDPAHCFVVGDSVWDLLVGPVPWPSDCSRVATAARSSTGRARTASRPTPPRR